MAENEEEGRVHLIPDTDQVEVFCGFCGHVLTIQVIGNRLLQVPVCCPNCKFESYRVSQLVKD